MLIHAGRRLESFLADNACGNFAIAATQIDRCAAVRLSHRHKRCVRSILNGNDIEVAQHRQRLYGWFRHQSDQIAHQTVARIFVDVGEVEAILCIVLAFLLLDFAVE